MKRNCEFYNPSEDMLCLVPLYNTYTPILKSLSQPSTKLCTKLVFIDLMGLVSHLELASIENLIGSLTRELPCQI